MAAWIKNKLQFDVSAPSEDELTNLAWDNLPEQLQRLANGFPFPPVVNCEDALESIPKLTALDTQQSPRFFNSAVVGYIRWQNAEILADLDAIKDMTECEAPVAGFITGAPLQRPEGNTSTPPEEDRFQVCDADFSQERVVWKSRTKPGLVVHGPPGTGKSQTIVNIIADALAHDRIVLMVCQKQAATRVVLERLRKVGLADLCMEVHDPESERVSVFKAIREQAQRLPNAVQATTTQVRRKQLAGEIATLKNELDGIATSLYELHSTIGLPFRKIKAREGRIYHAYPSVRPLPSLQDILRGMSAQALDEVCHDVKKVGQWFREADPQNNPWRDHQPYLQVNPITESDVQATLSRLRVLDAQHQEQIERHGAGQPLPPNVAEFVDTAQQFMKRLPDLVNNPQLPHSVLTLRWVEVIRRIDANQLQGYFQHCEDAVALSVQVSNSLIDPAWDESCSRLSAEQLALLPLQAGCILKHQGRWWRFLNPFFHAARRAIQEMSTEGAGKTVWQAASDLLTCARRTLGAAAWLCEQERKYDLLTRLLDRLLVPHQQGSLDNEIQSLDQSIQRSNVANSLHSSRS